MDLLIVTSDQKQRIHQLLNVKDEDIKRDVEIIKTWKSKQPHLPDNITDDFIENLLLKNKFRVERTKQKLDNYYTLRGQNLDFIQNLEEFLPSKSTINYLPLPCLTLHFERIILWRMKNLNDNDFDTMGVVKTQLAINELRLKYDYAIGVRLFVDCENATLKHLLSVNPLLLNKSTVLQERAFSDRILGIEFINFPPFAARSMAILKITLKPKIYDRIRIHKSLESLYKALPKENLPRDYGGYLDSIDELEQKWDKAMKKHHDFFVQNYSNVAEESLRSSENGANETFGVDGTFKKLMID